MVSRSAAIESGIASGSNAEKWNILKQLDNAESVLAFHQTDDFDGFLKNITASTDFPTNRHFDDELQWYLRLLYYDLFTDYHSLFDSTVSFPPLLDLVNKKLTVITNVPDSISINQQLYRAVVDPLLVKMAQFVVLADGDFRKPAIIARLMELKPPVDEITGKCLELLAGRKFLPLQTWQHALSTFGNPITKRLIKTHRENLHSNHIESNILCLPQYYDVVSISKLPHLFHQDLQNVEPLVNSMIVAGKLPDGTRIDQLRNMLEFRPAQDASINDKGARVSRMVDIIARMMETR